MKKRFYHRDHRGHRGEFYFFLCVLCVLCGGTISGMSSWLSDYDYELPQD
jgi:hypothetical protein